MSALIGVSLAMATGGLLARLESLLTDAGMLQGAVIGGALLAVAVGVRVPQRLAVGVCAWAWRRFVMQGRCSNLSGALVSPTGADLSLYWVALSVIALTAGVLTALLPLSVRWAGTAHDWLHLRFFWSPATHAALHAAMAFVAGLIPLAALGLSVSCAHHVSCRHGVWDASAIGWVLLGAGGGAAISTGIVRATGRGDLVMVAAALPTLLVAIIGVAASARRGGMGNSRADPVPLPSRSDRWPTLLRAGIVLVSTCGVCGAAVWHEHLAAGLGLPGGVAATLLGAMGVGFLAGRRVESSGRGSIGGFGVACVSAGVLMAVGATGLLDAKSAGGGADWAVACVGVAAAGFATAYGYQTLFARVANRSGVGAIVLARLIAGGAVGVWIGARVLTLLFGPAAAVCIVALVLLALGGMLIIHEPGSSPRTRRLRLLAVFGAISVMLALVSQAGRSGTSGPDPSTASTRTVESVHAVR